MIIKMLDIDHNDGCSCCSEPIPIGIQGWLNIAATVPNDDVHLEVVLYHNWSIPDTAYLVFGQVYRILGLYPPTLFMLIKWDNETKESQD
jgi:hypothetical protein